ncbi:tail assembly protein [Burkholderia cenocepacia]|uniref:tail assembly protein n=1 Tax=Burkholderia cenocepacia TaxID=95486 RepID=UPI0032119477
MTSQDRGVKYAVFAGKRNLTESQLEHPSGNDDIRIAPILVGSKSGFFSVIAGIALVVGAVAMGPIGAGWLSASVAMGIGMVGVSLALGGLAQLISPQQATQQKSLQSYNFNGAENTAYQGGPVPLLYGRMRIGSTVISEGLLAQDGTAQLVGGHYVATN